MKGFDLVTEGILTIGKLAEMLESYNYNQDIGNGPAAEILKMLLASDDIPAFLASSTPVLMSSWLKTR